MRTKEIILASVLVASGCATNDTINREPEQITHDLEGHTTGGRESAWKFAPGQIESLHVESRTIRASENIFVVRVITDAGQGRFEQRLRLTYSLGALQTVGQLSIRKL